jgi:hypothetical protein
VGFQLLDHAPHGVEGCFKLRICGGLLIVAGRGRELGNDGTKAIKNLLVNVRLVE